MGPGDPIIRRPAACGLSFKGKPLCVCIIFSINVLVSAAAAQRSVSICGEAREAGWEEGVRYPPSGFLPLGLRRSLGLFGPSILPKNLRIRPRGYVFMPRSILMLPGFKIPLKSEQITKNRIYRKPGFQKMTKHWFEMVPLYSFSRRIRISNQIGPKSIPEPILIIFRKISAKNRRAAASAGGVLND